MPKKHKIGAHFRYIKLNGSDDYLVKAIRRDGEKLFFFINKEGIHVTTKQDFFTETLYNTGLKFGKAEEKLPANLIPHALKIARTHPTFGIAPIPHSKPLTATLEELIGEKLQSIKKQ